MHVTKYCMITSIMYPNVRSQSVGSNCDLGPRFAQFGSDSNSKYPISRVHVQLFTFTSNQRFYLSTARFWLLYRSAFFFFFHKTWHLVHVLIGIMQVLLLLLVPNSHRVTGESWVICQTNIHIIVLLCSLVLWGMQILSFLCLVYVI